MGQVVRPAKLDLVSIALCCNNPDSGMFAEQLFKIVIGNDVLTLDSRYFPPIGPKLKYKFKLDKSAASYQGFGAAPVNGGIRIKRKFFPVWGYKQWWGNSCWDLVLMTASDTIDLVNYLKEIDMQVESGETRWFNYFQAENAIFDKDPNTWIRMLGKWGYQRP